MQWIEVTIKTAPGAIDLVCDRLTVLGFDSFIVDDQDQFHEFLEENRQYWDYVDEGLEQQMQGLSQIRLYLEEGPAVPETISHLKDQLAALRAQYPATDFGSLDVQLANVKDEDWAEEWKKNYKPFRIGSHLVVKPTWEKYVSQPGDLVIELDPGMAFGTGTHETTNMCMQLLERCLKPGLRVMDVGTGSGILAIAAAKLGAQNVLAIDIDPDAVKVAKENVELNHVEKQVRVVVGDLCKSEAMPCEVAVANIVADAICMLAGPMTRHLVKGGLLICSGIIREREADVQKAAKEAGYRQVDRIEKGEWVALCLKNEA